MATTFVSEARSKIVSSVIGSTDGTSARLPNAWRYRRDRRVRDDHRAWQLVRGDGLFDDRADLREARGVERRGGFRGRERLGAGVQRADDEQQGDRDAGAAAAHARKLTVSAFAPSALRRDWLRQSDPHPQSATATSAL